MHMADALISPAVGGTFWLASGALIAYCSRKVSATLRDNLVPMMGVLGAFIFAAQMINFSIPGTGSSGHLGGGLILSVLLGPYAALLVIASVLTVQAFFFADGGLLALGCNIFNLGFIPAFIAYPLIYRVLNRGQHGASRTWTAALVTSIVALQLGAISVVLQTTASGITELPFKTFAAMMLPIHLAIGIMEGLATAAVISFVARARPDALPDATTTAPTNLRPVIISLAVAAAILGGAISWFASTHPDGLEWSIAQTTGSEEFSSPDSEIHQSLANLQDRTAILPDYEFKSADADSEDAAWPAVSAGTSVSGMVGGVITLAMAALFGFVLKRRPIAPIREPGGG